MSVPSLPDLHSGRIHLRSPRPEDGPILVGMLAEPEVARWWGRWDAARVADMLEDTTGWVILVDGAVAGWLEMSVEDEPDYEHVGLDIALAAGYRGRGFGPAALRLVIGHLLASGHHRFTIDPAAANEAAIHAYASLGFRPVGIMRGYERGLDGTWHDNLLMDLLADEYDG